MSSYHTAVSTLAVILLASAAPCEAQQLTAGATATRYQQDKAGTLTGYAIDFRPGTRGIVVTWRAVTGSGSSQRVFCGFMEEPDTACPLESSGIHTRARTISLGYSLPIASAFNWTAAVVPELTWAHVQSREIGQQTRRRLEFEDGFPQVGFGFELTSPAVVLDRIRARFGGHAFLPLTSQADCVDCIRPPFSGVDYASALTAALSYSF